MANQSYDAPAREKHWQEVWEKDDIFQPELQMPTLLAPAKYLTLHHTESRFPEQAKGSKARKLTAPTAAKASSSPMP